MSACCVLVGKFRIVVKLTFMTVVLRLFVYGRGGRVLGWWWWRGMDT